jgi:hypothetical protein
MSITIRTAVAALVVTVVGTASGVVRGQDLTTSWLASDPNAVAAMQGAQSPVPGQPSENPVCDEECFAGGRPKWIATADMVLFKRTAHIESGVLGTASIEANDMTFDYKLGPRVDLIRTDVWNGWDLEVNYFGIDDWQSNATAILGSVGANLIYDSRLYSLEGNVRHQFTDTFTFLAGFRLLELQEGFLAYQSVPAAAQPALMSAQTKNQLYGLQIGGEQMLWAGSEGLCRVDGFVKAGVFGNHATQTSGSPLNSTLASASSNVPAFFGEVGVNVSYQLTLHWAVRAGYEVMWLQSVALAPDQFLQGTVAPSVDTSGGLLYHGGFAGAEFSF